MKTSATFPLSFILVFMFADDTRKNIYSYHEITASRAKRFNQEIISGMEMINIRFCIVVVGGEIRRGKKCQRNIFRKKASFNYTGNVYFFSSVVNTMMFCFITLYTPFGMPIIFNNKMRQK